MSSEKPGDPRPVAAPAAPASGLDGGARRPRTAAREAEREQELDARRVRHGSVIAVWVVAALFFAYSFWEGLAVLSSPPEMLSGASAGQRVLAGVVGAAIPVVAFGAAMWATLRVNWRQAVLVFAAAWGAGAAVWITFVFLIQQSA